MKPQINRYWLRNYKFRKPKAGLQITKLGRFFYPVFTNINYHWENASVVILEDGSKAVTVPITDQNPNPDYKGEKILYLYPFEESYDAVVYELSPDQNQTSKREGFQKLESYNGYISTWDLRKGFIKGQKFANSIATESVTFKIVTEEELKTHKLVPKVYQVLILIIILIMVEAVKVVVQHQKIAVQQGIYTDLENVC